MTSGSGKIWKSYARYPTYTKSYYRRWRRYWRTAGKRPYTKLMPNNYANEMVKIDIAIKNNPQLVNAYGYDISIIDSSEENNNVRIPAGRSYNTNLPIKTIIQTCMGFIQIIRKYQKFRIKSYALEGKVKSTLTASIEDVNACLITSPNFNQNISAFEMLQNPQNMRYMIGDETKRYFRKFPYWNEWVNGTNIPDFFDNTAFLIRSTAAHQTAGVIYGNFSLTFYIEGANKTYNQGIS